MIRNGVLLASILLLILAFDLPAAAQDSASLIVAIERVDDPVDSDGPWRASVAVLIQGTSLITNISFEIDGESPVFLDPNQDLDEWGWDRNYASLSVLTTAIDGAWSVSVFRGFPNPVAVVSTFTLSVSGLVEGDVYPTPTFTSPTNGDVRVAADTSISWTDPTGSSTPDLLFVELFNSAYIDGSVDQGDSSQDGLSVTDTTWQPGSDLSPGAQDTEVAYFEADESLVSPIVIQGTPSPAFAWVPSPYTPGGYPATDPLVAKGSSSVMAFGVSLLEDFGAYAVQTDTMGTSVGSTTVYAISDSTPLSVASVSEELASEASIVADITQSKAFSLKSAGGDTGSSDGQDGFILIGDLPALSNNDTAGPYSAFFGPDPDNRASRSFDRAYPELRAREANGVEGTSFRLLAVDEAGNQIATGLQPLTNAIKRYAFEPSDFSYLVNSTTFDPSQVVGVAIEHFGPPGTIAATDLRIDDVEISFVPEPGSALLGLSALASVLAVRRYRVTGQGRAVRP